MLAFISSLDIFIERAMVMLRAPLFTSFFTIITQAGNLVPIAFIVSVTVSYFILRRRNDLVFALLMAFAGTLITVAFIKFAVGRARPDVSTALMLAPFSSFPSLHAALTVSVYGILARLASSHIQSDAGKFATLACAILLMILVGVSRMYLGVHYFSDVVGGYFIGLVWFAISSQYLTASSSRWTQRRMMV